MLGTHHMMTGGAAGLAAGAWSGYVGLGWLLGAAPVPAIVCAAAVLGSLLPDIDIPTSTISKLLGGWSVPGRHRTWTHAIWVPAALAIICAVAGGSAMLGGIVVGWLMHELMDSLSAGGVVWTWPCDRYLDESEGYTYHVAPGYHRPKLYATGDAREAVLAWAVTVALCLLAVRAWI